MSKSITTTQNAGKDVEEYKIFFFFFFLVGMQGDTALAVSYKMAHVITL